MTSLARRRLIRDFKKLQEDPPGVSGAPIEGDIMKWSGIIFGPQGTPFEDGTFKLSMEFSEDYPNKPPVVKFLSKMFHPNVYTDGSICLDILQNLWSPTYDVSAILTSIQSLLDEPNPNSPANALAAQMYQEDRREYEKRVQYVVEQSWRSLDDDLDDSVSLTFLGADQKKALTTAPSSNGVARSSNADEIVPDGHLPTGESNDSDVTVRSSTPILSTIDPGTASLRENNDNGGSSSMR